MDAADRVGLPVSTLQADDLDGRMAGEDPDQLGPDVTAGADDPDPDLFLSRARPAVRPDRGRWLDPRAHGRTWSFAEDGFEIETIGRTAAITA
jgi:hypothetical protein